jgi:hypothetical protein
MRLFRFVLCAVIVASSALAPAASFAEEDTKIPKTEQPVRPPAEEAPKPATEPDISAQREGRLWVCCDDGRERWTATPEVCAQRKGQLLPGRFCERPKYVCCKQGRAEWWMPSADSCHADGGVVADRSYCR